MNTIDLYKYVKKSMPEVIETDIVTYINCAYKDLVNQDTHDLIFLNRFDDNFPYPILQGIEEESPIPDGAKDGCVYSQTKWEENWVNYLGKTSYSLKESLLVGTDNLPINLQVTIGGIAYDVNPRKVESIFTFYSDSVFNDFADIYRPIMMENQFYSKYTFVKVPFTTNPRNQGADPLITFFGRLNYYQQPFFCEFYYEPPDVLSVNSPMMIDIQRWKIALNEGAVAYYEKIVNGKSEKLEYFLRRWLPAFKQESSSNMEERESTRFKTRYV